MCVCLSVCPSVRNVCSRGAAVQMADTGQKTLKTLIEIPTHKSFFQRFPHGVEFFADRRTDGQTDRQTHIDPHFGGLKRAVSPGIVTFEGPCNSPQPFDCIFGSGTHSFCCPLGFGHSKNIWCSPKQHPALWES